MRGTSDGVGIGGKIQVSAPCIGYIRPYFPRCGLHKQMKESSNEKRKQKCFLLLEETGNVCNERTGRAQRSSVISNDSSQKIMSTQINWAIVGVEDERCPCVKTGMDDGRGVGEWGYGRRRTMRT